MHFTLKNYISCTYYCIFFDNILSYYTLLVMSSKRKYFSCTPLIKNLRNKNSNILTNLSPCMTIVFSASTEETPLLCVSSLENRLCRGSVFSFFVQYPAMRFRELKCSRERFSILVSDKIAQGKQCSTNFSIRKKEKKMLIVRLS